MLEKAFHKIPDGTNLILHSDQGWHYQHRKYRDMLKGKDIRQSMSRKGNCLDNAVVENFFGLLKSELLYLQKFASIEQFKTELVSYLEYYNQPLPAHHRYLHRPPHREYQIEEDDHPASAEALQGVIRKR